jgi:uncharacterized protein (UPF0332 family)
VTPEQQNLLEKAKQSLNAAKVLQNNNFSDYAASRAYYTMFYTVEALLLEKNLSFSSHAAVISAFGREFVKTGIIPQEFHRLLINAQDLRNTGDYGELNAVTLKESQEQIDNAEKLLKLIENMV